MKDPEFEFVYKQKFFGAIFFIVISLVLIPLSIHGIKENYILFDSSLILTRIALTAGILSAVLMTLLGFTVIICNYGVVKVISYKYGILNFPISSFNKNMIAITPANVVGASIKNLKGTKFLSFSYRGKRYGINDSLLEEKEFSLICNVLVKNSKRCKACQSPQVSWSITKGHCHNCETITPINSDEFDWDDAYKA